MTLDIPDQVEQGESIELKMEITNISGEDLVLEGRGDLSSDANECLYDFIITDEENRLHWRHFYDTPLEDIGCIRELPAGEQIKLTREWNGKDINDRTVESGRYTIIGAYDISSIEAENDSTFVAHEKNYFTAEPREIVIE